jgi:hypothetical protein
MARAIRRDADGVRAGDPFQVKELRATRFQGACETGALFARKRGPGAIDE